MLEKIFGRHGHHGHHAHSEQHGYYTSLVGVTDPNRDGSSPQKEIRKCAIGEAVELVREPDDDHGPNAVAVYRRKSRRRLGFLPPDAAELFAPRIDAGEPCPAAIYDVTGGSETVPTLGIRLRIEENPVQP